MTRRRKAFDIITAPISQILCKAKLLWHSHYFFLQYSFTPFTSISPISIEFEVTQTGYFCLGSENLSYPPCQRRDLLFRLFRIKDLEIIPFIQKVSPSDKPPAFD